MLQFSFELEHGEYPMRFLRFERREIKGEHRFMCSHNMRDGRQIHAPVPVTADDYYSALHRKVAQVHNDYRDKWRGGKGLEPSRLKQWRDLIFLECQHVERVLEDAVGHDVA